jgi:hypothetical protein
MAVINEISAQAAPVGKANFLSKTRSCRTEIETSQAERSQLGTNDLEWIISSGERYQGTCDQAE